MITQLTGSVLWANTIAYVRSQMPDAKEETVIEVAGEVFQSMKFLLEAPDPNGGRP